MKFSVLIFSLSIVVSTFLQNYHRGVIEQSVPGNWEEGVALYSFNQFSFLTSLKKADSCGVRYVEGFYDHKMGSEFGDKLMGDLSTSQVHEMKKMLDNNGLRMESMYMGGAKNREDWLAFFKMAKICGMKYLICEPPKKDLDLLDSLAGVYNIKIAIHEHSRKSSEYWHPDSVLVAIKGRPNIGACADLGHWVRSGLEPVECLKKLKGRILEIHLKDVNKSGDYMAKDVPVGMGVINFPAIAKELKSQHFQGTVYVECEHDFQNNVPDVKKALTYFAELKK